MNNLTFRPLLIHKIILKMSIDPTCYELIKTAPWKGNLGRSYSDPIENKLVTYTYYRNGKVKMHVACSNNPFRLETDDYLAILYSFFGQVRDRLEYQISDPHGRLVPEITKWILEQCDFNKDVPVTEKAQVTLPDIQLSTLFETFRLYIKNLHGEANYRCEVSQQVDQLLPQYLALTINPNFEILSELGDINKDIQEIKNMLRST